MMDINKLRRLALDGDLDAVQAIIIRLEWAEKERDGLRAELTQLHKEADKFGDGIDWIQRALQAEAKIEELDQETHSGASK